MSVVVEQTAPFSPATLQLNTSERWVNILHRFRPTLEIVDAGIGLQVLTNQQKLSRNGIAIVAVPEPGNFSSKLLETASITAIVLGTDKGQTCSQKDVRSALSHAGVDVTKGMAVLQPSEHFKIQNDDGQVMYVQTGGVSQFDHIIHLLNTCEVSCLSSCESLASLLHCFERDLCEITSEFSTQKLNNVPAIKHSDGLCELKSTSNAVAKDLAAALAMRPTPSQPCTWSIHFADINGLSRLEIYIIAAEIGRYIDSKGLAFRLSHSSIIDYSDPAPGYVLGLCALPAHLLPPQAKPVTHTSTARVEVRANTSLRITSKMQFVDSEVRRRIVHGCEAVIEAETTITEYDTIVGDGDCGYTLRDGAKQVLHFIEGKDLAALPDVVAALVRDLEINMGGTSGALYCIFLTALASSLASESSVAQALQQATEQLMKYTRARQGDRTMMDALIPFVDTLGRSGSASQAIIEARSGVEGTKRMEAKLGRSTYLDEAATRGVPDPGAYGLLILLEGITRT